MARVYSQSLGNAYNGAVRAFVADKRAFRVTVPVLASVEEGYAPVLQAALELDRLVGEFTKPDNAAAMKAFPRALEKYCVAKDKYKKVIAAAIAGPRGFDMKASVPASHRALHVLGSELDAVAARADTAYRTRKPDVLAKQGKIDARKDVGATEKGSLKALVTFASMFRTAVVKAEASIQKIKADPSYATYNREMAEAGRGVGQNLLNIVKMKQQRVVKDLAQVKALPDPKGLGEIIKEYADNRGKYRELPATTTDQEVMVALRGFSGTLKAVKQRYAALLSGKM